MYNPGMKKVILSRDMKFCESNFENVASAGKKYDKKVSVYTILKNGL